MCNYGQNIGLWPLVSFISQKQTLLWNFQVKLLRIDQDQELIMCNYGWNIGLLPLIFIVSQKWALLWKFHVKLTRIGQDIQDYVFQ